MQTAKEFLENVLETWRAAWHYDKSRLQATLIYVAPLWIFSLFIGSLLIGAATAGGFQRFGWLVVSGLFVICLAISWAVHLMQFSISTEGIELMKRQALRSLTRNERQHMTRAGVADTETYQQTFERMSADMEALRQRFEAYRPGNL